MSNIPGIQICPVEGEIKELISFPSFTGTIRIPEAHKYGTCQKKYELKKLITISEGSFGIYKCLDKKTGEYRILKKFQLPHDFQNGVPKSILRELNILNSLNHVNIIRSYGPVSSKSFYQFYISLDYCHFSLKDVINEKFPIYEKSVVKCIIQQLFEGLEYIHSAQVIHRDICVENIMFDDEGMLKIIGFKFSRYINQVSTMSPVQSELRYRAPELFFNSKNYDMKVDMWSAGSIFAELVTMKPLFTGDSELAVLKSIFEVLGTPSENVWPGFDELFINFNNGLSEILNRNPYNDLKRYITGVSTPCYDIISNLLIYFSGVRLSAKECLESPYFKESPAACSPLDLLSILKNVKEPA